MLIKSKAIIFSFFLVTFLLFSLSSKAQKVGFPTKTQRLDTLVLATTKTKKQAPDTARVGCYVISLHDLDFPEQQYTARFWLWLIKDTISNVDKDVEIPNAKEMKVDNMIMEKLGNKGWLQMKLKCIMKQSWNVKHFPFDKQILKIDVENPQFETDDLVFKVDTLGKSYDPALFVEGWKITNFKLSTGVSSYKTGFGDNTLKKQESSYAKFTIAIELQREAWELFFKLFLGMYIAFAISFVSFFVDAEHAEPRFGLPVGGLFSGVGNKYVIDSYLPTSSTLTIVDTLHGLTFVMIFVIIAFSALILQQSEDNKLKNLAESTNKVVAWSIAIIYVLINAVSIALAVWN